MKTLKIDYGNPQDDAIYNIEGDKELFFISGSPLGNWTRNDLIYLSLKDDGNGLSITFSNMGREVRLDYHQAELLRLALKINSPEGKLSEVMEKPFVRL